MSKERELLKRSFSEFGKIHADIKLLRDTQTLLAQHEQEPEAWILEDKKTGYRRQSAYKPTDLDEEACNVIPLYTAPPKREPLSDGATADMYHANKKATHPDSYWSGVYDAEKAHGIGGEE